jgi:hypothetical protein
MLWNDDAQRAIEEQLNGPEILACVWLLLTDEQKQEAFGFVFDGLEEE